MSWDAQIELLKIQYQALKPLERTIRADERAEATRRANQRIREARQALADEFKRYRESGMPQYAIQEVLGTRDWGTMKQWQELMNMKTPSEIRQAEKIANQGYTYENGILTLTRNHLSEEMEPMAFDVAASLARNNGLPVALDEPVFMKYARSQSSPQAFSKFVMDIAGKL